MYQPKAFQLRDLGTVHELIRTYPLGTLVVNGPEGLLASPLPFVLEAGRAGTPGDACPDRLLAHLPKSDPLVAAAAGGCDCLVVFQGPDGYISPSLYASKQKDSRVVPTWNYAAVHAHGRLTVHSDAGWIEAQLQMLIAEHEGGRQQPWRLEDAPRPYVERLMKALTGFAIEVRRYEGKTKLSQNKSAEDRQSVLEGLEAEAPQHPLTELMRRYCPRD